MFASVTAPARQLTVPAALARQELELFAIPVVLPLHTTATGAAGSPVQVNGVSVVLILSVLVDVHTPADAKATPAVPSLAVPVMLILLIIVTLDVKVDAPATVTVFEKVDVPIKILSPVKVFVDARRNPAIVEVEYP